MLQDWIRSCFLIFMAEMGDKTQILAMAFATRYAVSQVLAGVAIGSFLNHGIAVALGTYLSTVVPLGTLRLIAAVTFIGFGLWTLLNEDDDEEETTTKGLNPIWTVAMAFFIGELGDKTQLAAITLSTGAQYPLFVLLGTVTGMVLTSGLGIFVGSKVGDKIPALAIKIASSLIFTTFGVVGLFEGVPSQYVTSVNVVAFLGILLATNAWLISRAVAQGRAQQRSRFQRQAAALHEHMRGIQKAVNNICLGTAQCGTCQSDRCVVGFSKHIVETAIQQDDVLLDRKLTHIPRGLEKNFDRQRIGEALVTVASSCLDCGKQHSNKCAMNKTREALEVLYFGARIPFKGNMGEYIRALSARDTALAKKIDKLRSNTAPNIA